MNTTHLVMFFLGGASEVEERTASPERGVMIQRIKRIAVMGGERVAEIAATKRISVHEAD